MTKENEDVHVLSVSKELKNAHNWKHLARWNGLGFYELQTEDTGDVPVRIFLTPKLLNEAEDILYRQIVNATRFQGVKLVVITPDTHYGYGVPVGCVILTDAEEGAVAMGPVGFDIGCFTGNTLVPTADGKSYPIGELAKRNEEIFVYAISPEKKIVVAKATAQKTRVNAPLVKVRLDNEREIICTPDHQFMLRDGSYCEAKDLKAETSLMPFDWNADGSSANERVTRKSHELSMNVSWKPLADEPSAFQITNHKVVSVESLDYREDVYCLTVPEYGNFALDAGVFVHNCGMMSARSNVDWREATPRKKLEFNEAVMERVEMGAGGKSYRLGKVSEDEFQNLIRGGAEYYVEKYGATFDRSRAERHRIPVADDWDVPWGGKGKPERGLNQLGSLGGGNHFIELQRCEETKSLFLQVHTGSRGFGHGMATNYFELAKLEKPKEITDLDLGYFTPESKHYRDYLNAVAAGGNYAILNRLVIFEAVAEAFKKVFRADLDLIYEISHNLVQNEWHPDYGEVFVHRKGATRAFPAGHPALKDTHWEETGHPVLIPGSNKDFSYILRPLEGAVRSGFSVNHGAGRRLSRNEAFRSLSQKKIDAEYKEADILVNTDGHVPLDEAAPCYKSSFEVIEAVVGAGLAEVEYTLWPLASLKGTEEKRHKKKVKEKTRDLERKKERERKSNRHY